MSRKVPDYRTRNWGFILYPESMPKDTFEILDGFHIPCAVSPLHDLDVDENGEVKKAHYHCALCFSGVKAYNQVLSILAPLGVSHIESINEIHGYIRYFCHLDSPSKVRYSIEKIRSFGGLDISNLLNPTSSQVDQYILEMRKWIEESNVLEFSDLYDYSAKNYRDTWFYALNHCCSNVLNLYLNSRRNRLRG